MFGDNMGNILISPNIKKESVRIDPNGNLIDSRTKQIIQKNEPDYIPTKEEIEAQINAVPAPEEPKPPVLGSTLPIAVQIEQAKAHLAALELLKQDEIKRMKEELARLEANE
jgi:hypothetical protein